MSPDPPLEPDADLSEPESDSDSTELFTQILDSIHQDRIPAFCLTIRKNTAQWNKNNHSKLLLPILEPPLFGSYHVLFPVRFDDGLKWLLKIPAHGTQALFNDSAAAALTTEAKTMAYLRQNTTIAIPQVIAYKASLDNDIGCPFILMNFVSGISLYDCWFNRERADVMECRMQALSDVAAAMAQLNRFAFEYGGSLRFDDDNCITNIGTLRCVDHKASLDRAFTGDGTNEVCYFDAGPFSEVTSFYTRFLDEHPEPHEPLQKGLSRLLRLLINWIPEPEDTGKKFVLAHPDFDIQNFIVSPTGHLQGIIDWDGVAAVPRSIGCESFPGWLTRDWDPAMYGWNEDMERGVDPEGLWEDSPDTLAQHRADYRVLMQSALSRDQHRGHGQDQIPSTPRTAISLYVENLLIASSNPPCMFPILQKFINAMNKLAASDEREDFDIFDIADRLADETLGKDELLVLQKAFQAVFQND